MSGKGGVNSGPGNYGVPDGVWTDGPGFSLCATPLESFGPVFQDGRVDRMNEQRGLQQGKELKQELRFGEGRDTWWKI